MTQILGEFAAYIDNNARAIVNYGEADEQRSTRLPGTAVGLHLDLVRQPNLVPRQSAEAPVVLWRLRNRYFNLIWQTISLFAYPLEQQSNQLLLGFDGTTFKHTDLYDRIARTSASGVIEIIRFQVKEAVRSFVGWKLECLDYT
jgi:hypothetical protein